MVMAIRLKLSEMLWEKPHHHVVGFYQLSSLDLCFYWLHFFPPMEDKNIFSLDPIFLKSTLKKNYILIGGNPFYKI